MFKRQTAGSVVCPSCGSLVGIQDERCFRCGRWNPGLWGFAPLLRRLGNDLGFVPIVIGGCTLLYILSLLATVAISGPGALGASGLFSILSPSDRALFLFGGSGSIPIFYYGRWWTILSAGWLHGNLLHILFNMLWVRQLAPAVADMYGAGRMVVIYTIAGVAGFLLSSTAGAFNVSLPLFHGAGFTVGASASIMGLLGALVHYGRRSVSSAVTTQAFTYAVILFVFGLAMPGVDNFAHAGGFAGGYLASMWLNPLRPERQEHLIAALGCLVLVAISIVASVVTGMQYLR
jgi:rhomboid protease GluP